MNWIMAIAGTVLSVSSIWLYGNKSRVAPVLGVISCAIWVAYNIKYEQYALLIPIALKLAISIRNLMLIKEVIK